MHFFVLALGLCLVAFSSQNIASMQSALALCAQSIAPALFPYFVFSGLVIRLGLCDSLPPCLRRLSLWLFGSPQALSLFFLGILGGYPLGTKNICDLYVAGSLNKNEAERLLGFCCNSGPAFIVGIAGGLVFSSMKIGLVLYFLHCISAAFLGFLGRKGAMPPTVHAPQKPSYPTFPSALTSAVKGAMEATLTVCAFVLFFSVLMGFFPHMPHLFKGLIELGAGLVSLPALALNYGASLVFCSFLLAFGGISVHFQALSFLLEGDLSPKPYLLGKIAHGFLAAGATFLCILFKIL